ncbi:unnamed protein product [Clonostachys rosea f. rosea IK726]|uniref:Uncharacterized protein n=1 Tax=Clonostachys rosea f. rosea IK726 TaxID=1349383 RepID=A0ACA9TAK1_BIOOC|nr:unnamed protein product [Clonostachys rosea f. rosea IK726]
MVQNKIREISWAGMMQVMRACLSDGWAFWMCNLIDGCEDRPKKRAGAGLRICTVEMDVM